MEHKITKVNCSFCGKEIECPEDMMNAKKHSCFECFDKLKEHWSDKEIGKIHVDMPMDKVHESIPETMTNSLVKEAFPNIWKERKQELKGMSKKELAEEMFGAGAYIAIDNMMHAFEHDPEDEHKNSEIR